MFHWCSLVFIGVSLVFHWCSLMFHWCFIGVHWCSLVFHWCFIGVHWCCIGVHWCFIGVHWCSLVFHWCSLVFIGVPLVFIGVHWCSFVFTGVHWCSIGVHWCSIGVHWCSIGVPLVFIGVPLLLITTLRLWKQSTDLQLRYTTMFCDGDSKSFDAVVEAEVHGKSVSISKEDCVNHVSKRMVTALRNLVASCRAQKESIAGKGKLTQKKIEKIQNFYGRAIKDCGEDVQMMHASEPICTTVVDTPYRGGVLCLMWYYANVVGYYA